jgi:hypothetical protein
MHRTLTAQPHFLKIVEALFPHLPDTQGTRIMWSIVLSFTRYPRDKDYVVYCFLIYQIPKGQGLCGLLFSHLPDTQRTRIMWSIVSSLTRYPRDRDYVVY